METHHIEEDVPGGVPLKMWTRGVPVEEPAKKQLENIARMPFVHSHLAVMPDVHLGKGATVGLLWTGSVVCGGGLAICKSLQV